MNRLLDALSDEDRAVLAPVMKEVDFEAGRILQEGGQPVEQAYFPYDSVVSQGARPDDGSVVETGTVGCEGMVPPLALIGDSIAFERSFVQVPGRAAAVPAAVVRDLFDRSPGFRRLLGAYVQAYAAQVAQSVACNAMHPNEARLSRWLLMCLDRHGPSARLPLTTRFLAEMLGIGRPGISVVAGTLQTAGLIRIRPDGVEILDRAGLEEAACDCYSRVRDKFERLSPPSRA